MLLLIIICFPFIFTFQIYFVCLLSSDSSLTTCFVRPVMIYKRKVNQTKRLTFYHFKSNAAMKNFKTEQTFQHLNNFFRNLENIGTFGKTTSYLYNRQNQEH